MSLYESLKQASDNKDVQAYLDLLHDDYVFVRHQTNTEVNKLDWTPVVTAMMQSDALEVLNARCLYENSEILVMHQVMKFPDATKEAVLIVHNLKEGKIIRSETGATPLK